MKYNTNEHVYVIYRGQLCNAVILQCITGHSYAGEYHLKIKYKEVMKSQGKVIVTERTVNTLEDGLSPIEDYRVFHNATWVDTNAMHNEIKKLIDKLLSARADVPENCSDKKRASAMAIIDHLDADIERMIERMKRHCYMNGYAFPDIIAKDQEVYEAEKALLIAKLSPTPVPPAPERVRPIKHCHPKWIKNFIVKKIVKKEKHGNKLYPALPQYALCRPANGNFNVRTGERMDYRSKPRVYYRKSC